MNSHDAYQLGFRDAYCGASIPRMIASQHNHYERGFIAGAMERRMQHPPDNDGQRQKVNILDLHERMTGHLFPAYSSTDERFLALALCGEVGELANMIKKRWRDGADLTNEIRDELADIRVYLELLAATFGIEGDKLDMRVQSKLEKVAERYKKIGKWPSGERVADPAPIPPVP